jgi:hypothetical protein
VPGECNPFFGITGRGNPARLASPGLPLLPAAGGTPLLASRADAEEFQIMADIRVAPRGHGLAESVDDAVIDAFHPATLLADEVMMVLVVDVLVAPFIVTKITAPDQIELFKSGNASVNRHPVTRLAMEVLANLVNCKWPVVTD